MTDKEEVWAQVAKEHPEFTPAHDAAGNHHAVREIVLGGSVTWAGVWQRFEPRPGMKVMDVGANAGIFSAYCALHGADVVSYEPFADAFAIFSLMVHRTGLDERIKYRNAAIWTYSGECPYLGTASKLEDSPAYNGSVQSNGINWTVDDLCNAKRIKCVSLDEAVGEETWDMVKIDTEGSECEILLAASLETLRRIKFAYVEFHPWVSESLYKQTVARLEAVYNFQGAYWNSDIGRWEAAYLTL